VTGTLTGHAPSRAGRSAAPHPMAPCPLGIGRRAAVTGMAASVCTLSQVSLPCGGSVVSNRHVLMLNFYPSAGTPAGDFEGRRPFIRVPDDDLSCQVMTFPVPLGHEGTRASHALSRRPWKCSAPRRSPGRSTCTSVYDRRFHRVDHPNNWDDIAQWFRKNLTYEADEMFQPYI